MAIFDIPVSVTSADYSLYELAQKQTRTPVEIVSGKTETLKTLKQITSYIGEIPSCVNELI